MVALAVRLRQGGIVLELASFAGAVVLVVRLLLGVIVLALVSFAGSVTLGVRLRLRGIMLMYKSMSILMQPPLRFRRGPARLGYGETDNPVLTITRPVQICYAQLTGLSRVHCST
jgi:hypothetical protein